MAAETQPRTGNLATVSIFDGEAGMLIVNVQHPCCDRVDLFETTGPPRFVLVGIHVIEGTHRCDSRG